jgi:hypothetical protein
MLHRALFVFLLAFVAGACSTVRTPEIMDASRFRGIRTAYVVKDERSKKGIEVALQTALAKRGIRARYGRLEYKPTDADIYLTFVDHWRWDVTMYLKSLDVSIYNNRTDELIGSGSFRNSFLHSFPDPVEKVQEVVDSIFEAAKTRN